MFKRILVPVDGSVEAETVFPYVRDIASKFNSEVDILSVGVGSKRRRVNQLLEDYVHHAVERLQKHDITSRAIFIYTSGNEQIISYGEETTSERNIKTSGTVVYGGPADNILNFANQHKVNLIIMATHGLGGLTRWWLGSVSEKVIAGSAVPVLLIHSKQAKELDHNRKVTCKRILAPVDGSHIGEAALRDMEILAAKTGASITLLHIIPELQHVESRIMGKELDKFVDSMHEAGQKYLDKVSSRIASKGIEVNTRMHNGDPAEIIIETAKHEKSDLIAMSTHGRSGIARWVLGSVADKVLHECKLPMWLVRSKQIVNTT